MRFILAVLLWAISPPAWAGVSCSLPFNIQNGQPADATQVMANYNALVTCLSNAAAAGANSDITSLNGLTTPLPANAGGTTTYKATASSAGTANAQTITSTVPTFVLQAGSIVSFKVGISNTAVTTLNVSGSGPLPLYRNSQLGSTASVGGELIAGQRVTVVYDGAEYQCLSCGQYYVGQVLDVFDATLRKGYLYADGSCVSQTTYADLYAVIGTAGLGAVSCSAGLFALPDLRGNVTAALDNQGVNGNAGRLSNCGDDTTFGDTCGVQQQTIGRNALPNQTLTVSGTTGAASTTPAICDLSVCGGTIGTIAFLLVSSGNSSGWPSPGTNTPSFAISGTTSSINGGVTQVPLGTIQPLQFDYKIIKY